MALLSVGMLFSSYEEFKARIDEYQSQNSLNLRVRGSITIEATKKKFPTRNLNEALKYHELLFTCSDCMKYKSWNKSVNNVEIDGVNVRVVATKDGQHLEIRRMNEKHNHPTSGTVIKTITSPRKKTIHTDGENISSPKRKRKKSLPDSISFAEALGKQIERWQSLKEHLNIYSDEEFAEVLLNRLQQDFGNQTSRKVNPVSTPFLSGMQLSTMPMSTPTPIGVTVKREQATIGIKREQGTIGIKREQGTIGIKREHGTVQANEYASGQQGQGREYFSDLHQINDENHKDIPGSGQQETEREYFSDLHFNYENHKYKHSPASPTLLPQSEMKPQVIPYYYATERNQTIT